MKDETAVRTVAVSVNQLVGRLESTRAEIDVFVKSTLT